MCKLGEVYSSAQGSETKFKYKSILFIGSESYDAATITVLEGLHELGFTIYTLSKPNINSWFCNTVINSPNHFKFDFILSNLHWGTRWSYYDRYRLSQYPKVLIDGDDNHSKESWKDKYVRYCKTYISNPSEALKDQERQPYRWVEPLGNYSPDVVFTAQKMLNDSTSFYLPFGIHKQYLNLYENRTTQMRTIDFTFIPGPGERRARTERWVNFLLRYRLFPGQVHNWLAYGDQAVPEKIKMYINDDDNIHSYHRWTMSKVYFRILNSTKVLIYPGVRDTSQWDSKRPWEAYASGCLVMLARPTSDVSEYPATQICKFTVYDSLFELMQKCWFLYMRPSFLDKLRLVTVQRAVKFFSPKPIANYFLAQVNTKLT